MHRNTCSCLARALISGRIQRHRERQRFCVLESISFQDHNRNQTKKGKESFVINNGGKTSNKAAAQTSYENRCSSEKLTTKNRKTPIKNTLRVDLGAREGM